MSPRVPLPPPPPPAEIRSWPDREARLVDRALAMDELGRRLLGGGRLALFLLWFALLEFGWSLVGLLLIALGHDQDALTVMIMLFAAVLGLGVLGPALRMAVRGVRQDRTVRIRLAQWAALDRHRPTDARLRAPVLSLAWLLLSCALCVGGLWVAFAVPAGATREDGGYGLVAYGMGASLILWVTGLVGLTKIVGHHRMANRLTGPNRFTGPNHVTARSRVSGPGRPRGGRSASSEPPRPE